MELTDTPENIVPLRPVEPETEPVTDEPPKPPDCFVCRLPIERDGCNVNLPPPAPNLPMQTVPMHEVCYLRRELAAHQQLLNTLSSVFAGVLAAHHHGTARITEEDLQRGHAMSRGSIQIKQDPRTKEFTAFIGMESRLVLASGMPPPAAKN